jgi:rhodanese-related sulfurtransferase/DNA-binding transcriptional ArsR family regulator
MDPRAVKDRLFAAWADIAQALASPRRIEILDLLAQGERTVEALARATGLTVNNTSSHLSVLKAVRLVETRKDAQFVFYRLADPEIVELLHAVQKVARRRLHEIEYLARTFFEARDTLEPIDAAELRRRLKAGDVTVVDVRPALEYEAGHIEGALSLPLDSLETHVRSLPKGRPVVAYCRGPYCVLAIEAVERLRTRGYDARRLATGFPEWQLAKLPVATGTSASAATSSSTRRRRKAG